ncbi:MAG: hypothetical protein ACI81P_002785 [Neolewinella sp.]|jgi:hypothetical protein
MSDHDEPRLGEFLVGLREKGDGFRTPSPEFLEELANRTLAEERRPARVRPLHLTWWSAAAAVMLLLLVTFLLLPKGNEGPVATNDSAVSPSSEALLVELDADDIDAYISDQLDEFEFELYANAPVNE